MTFTEMRLKPFYKSRAASALAHSARQKFFLDSYGFPPERSCKDALRRVDHLLKPGYRWVVEIDFESYFDTIPHEPLMQLAAEKISDGRVLKLVKQFLRQSILTDEGSWTPDKGSPQGVVISPPGGIDFGISF